MKLNALVALVACLAVSALGPAPATAQLLPGEREAVIKAIPSVVAAGREVGIDLGGL